MPLERLEDALGERRAHADAGVADAELILRAAAQRTGVLADADRDRAARRGELDGVGQQVEQDLPEARPVAADVLVRHVDRVHVQLELLGVHLSADDGLDVVQHIGQADLALFEMELAALDAAHVQDVVDEREQMAARGEGLGQIVPDPFGVADVADRKGGEADDGVHRGADVVRHIGQEVALCAAGGLGGRDRVRKRLIDLSVGRAVGQYEDILGPACRLGAHGDDMEPAALAGRLMDIIHVPFALLAALHPLEEVLVAVGGVRVVQQLQHMDVLPHLFERHAEQTLDVRADIVRVRGLAVQHEENVVDAVREPVEQLVPVQDLGVLPAERGAAPTHDERDGQHREQDHDNGHDLDRSEPQPVHAGVDDADRDKAEHGPVLDARVFVDQIVPRSAQRQHQTAAPALREVVAQRVEFFLGQVGMFAQLREEVIDRVVAVVAAVEHDAPVRIDDIAVSRAVEGGIVERVQHRVVIVGDGDRVVGEAAIGSLRLRAGEHKHLRLSGQRRVQHDVLSGGKRPVQVDL